MIELKMYPTKEQKKFLDKHFKAVREVYNFFLTYSKNCYKNTKTSTDYNMWSRQLTRLKKTNKYKWLSELNPSALQFVLFGLHNKYKKFFSTRQRCDFPRKLTFSNSFTIVPRIKFIKNKNNVYIKISKFKKPIKLENTNMQLEKDKVKRVLISKNNHGEYSMQLFFKEK